MSMLVELVAPQRVEFDPAPNPGRLVVEMCHAPEQTPAVVAQGRYRDDQDSPIRPFRVSAPDKEGLVRSSYALHAHPVAGKELNDPSSFDISCEIAGVRCDWLVQVFRDREGPDPWVALVVQNDYSIACRLPGYDPLERPLFGGGAAPLFDLTKN